MVPGRDRTLQPLSNPPTSTKQRYIVRPVEHYKHCENPHLIRLPLAKSNRNLQVRNAELAEEGSAEAEYPQPATCNLQPIQGNLFHAQTTGQNGQSDVAPSARVSI